MSILQALTQDLTVWLCLLQLHGFCAEKLNDYFAPVHSCEFSHLSHGSHAGRILLEETLLFLKGTWVASGTFNPEGSVERISNLFCEQSSRSRSCSL